MIGWQIDTALLFCTRLTEVLKPVGYAVALTGSVLTKGRSRKDLDLIVYPLSTARQGLEQVRAVLEQFGMVRLVSVERVHQRWRELGSADEKHVEVWLWSRHRVDLFFLT